MLRGGHYAPARATFALKTSLSPLYSPAGGTFQGCGGCGGLWALWGGPVRGLRGFAQDRLELAARGDAQLHERVAQVPLDGLHGDEERLGDLAVGEALGRELSHAALARGQGRGALPARAAGLGARGDELLADAAGEGGGSGGGGEVERAAQAVAGVGHRALLALEHPELAQRAGVLEAVARLLEDLRRLGQAVGANGGVGLGERGGAQRQAGRARRVGGAGQPELLGREGGGGVAVAEADGGDRRAGAPRDHGRGDDPDLGETAAGLGEVLLGEPRPALDEPQAPAGGAGGGRGGGAAAGRGGAAGARGRRRARPASARRPRESRASERRAPSRRARARRARRAGGRAAARRRARCAATRRRARGPRPRCRRAPR